MRATLSELGASLSRNKSMTISLVVTMTVSLLLVALGVVQHQLGSGTLFVRIGLLDGLARAGDLPVAWRGRLTQRLLCVSPRLHSRCDDLSCPVHRSRCERGVTTIAVPFPRSQHS